MHRVKVAILAALVPIACSANAADLHPIVEVQSGYLLGAVADGKWIKADYAANALSNETLYRIYGVNNMIGDAKGGKPKYGEAPCEETLTVELSPKPAEGVIAIAAAWNALPRKLQLLDPAQKAYIDVVRDFLRTKGIEQPKVKIDKIIRVDLNGDGEEEVLISATNYFSKDESVPMRSPAGSYSCVLLRRVAGGKVQTQLVEGEFYPKAYRSLDSSSFNAPNVHRVIGVFDLDGDGKMEIVIGSRYYEGEATSIYRCDAKECEALLSVSCGA